MVRVWVNGVEVGLWSGNIWYVLVVVFVWWSTKLATVEHGPYCWSFLCKDHHYQSRACSPSRYDLRDCNSSRR